MHPTAADLTLPRPRVSGKKSGRRYTAEQKAEAIRRVQGGETQAAVAKEAGISARTVGQ